MNRLINQALAIRSTKTPRRVTQVRPRRPARGCTGARALARSRPRPPARAASRPTARSAADRPGAPKKSIAATSATRRSSRATSPGAGARARDFASRTAAAYSAPRAWRNSAATSRSLRPSTKSPRHTDPSPPPPGARRQPPHSPLRGRSPRRAEEVDRRDLGDPPVEPRHLAGCRGPREGLRVAHRGRVLGPASLAEQRRDVAVAQAVHEVPPAHRPLAPAVHDFLEQPAEVLDRLIVVGEDPDGVLDGHGADALQPAPHLHPEVVGLRRDVVKQQQPTSARGIAHRGATRLTITSVSSNIRRVEWWRNACRLATREESMNRQIGPLVLAALMLVATGCGGRAARDHEADHAARSEGVVEG